MNSLKLKTFAAEAGADLVGIASVERFEELPQEKQPRVIYPETRSVIIIGRRITRGTFRGV
ncbi:MAG: (4Fe-4S)-binding protein, partial [Candidatus Omnitrophica bacterium]|nr:(4Fe-4S)-binding protein [Candidatus Omnitrophota bacterium]